MDPTTDIVVIGAGIVGCAVAFELARRGASVQVVDDRPAGMGATQASAGVLAPYIEARHNPSLGMLAARSLEAYDTFVADVMSAGGAHVTYRRTGSLDVALDADGMRGLEAAAKDLLRRGVVAEVLDAGQTRHEEPHLTGRVAGGLFIPAHGFVAALELTRALATAARRHGAQIVEHNRVRHIVRSGDDLIVETERGPLTGNRVVLAAGSWSGQIGIEGIETRVPIRPIRGQLLELAWRGPTLRRVLWGSRCYFVPWDDGTLLAGATVEDVGFDEQTTVAGVRYLIEAASELVPDVSTAHVLSTKAGLRPASGDDLPVIGASKVVPGVMYATGHYRNGILLAPLTARLVADAMLDGVMDPLLELTSPQRFGEL